jgi:FAD/FMN-containing dehydrogenase/Fe-S oxidoreductase
MPLPPDFVAELRRRFRGDIRDDAASRVLYSTDASIYQIEPLGVVLPRTQDDLQAAVELASKYGIPILPRGSGSSLAGQAIGAALIIDCSRWLDRLVAIDAESRTATVEPGLILERLNRAAANFGLQYGPDPASAERATLGGVVANNATGAHSILYGMTADHILSAEVLMADGSPATWGEEPVEHAPSRLHSTRLDAFRQAVLDIRRQDADLIVQNFPRTWRNSAGYRLNYLLPWSATRPPRWSDEHYPALRPRTVNLAALLAGSEGTLAVIRRATVRLVPKPRFTVLGILAYESAGAACDAVPAILQHGPSAVELIPRMIFSLARSVPSYAPQMGWVTGNPAAVLVVEFSGDDTAPLVEAAKRLRDDVTLAISAQEQAQVWAVRKAGLGILDARPQSRRPAAFVEDCAIPVERLGDFVREFEALMREFHTEAGIYAHASAGCLHVRPVLDLRTAQGVRDLRLIAGRVLAITLRLGGAMASEHGDGIARGEWLEATYGKELVEAMRALKRAADPENLLNPGKMFDAPPMDTHLRYGPGYAAFPWAPALDFAANGGLNTAIEQCNGQGVCRKDTGVMCPSFQATREEKHSTRGRANLLRFLITSPSAARQHVAQVREHGSAAQGAASGAVERPEAVERMVFDALDLCLACKGCKAECPSGVDMAKLKFEFLSRYYGHHVHSPRDYFFGYFHGAARILSNFAPVVNLISGIPVARRTIARALHITPNRPFPHFRVPNPEFRTAKRRSNANAVIYLADSFTHYVEPQVEQAAFDLLEHLGYQVIPAHTMAAGAALLSKGFVRPAARHASKLIDELHQLDGAVELPIVGVEPSEVYAFKHEYQDLLPERGAEIARRAAHTWLLDEFLIRSGRIDRMRIGTSGQKIFFHPHCHQRAEGPAPDGLPTGTAASVELLRACGYEVQLSDAGCCGMAGTFGYEAEHYAVSQQVGALKLYPRLRKLDGVPVAASGAACRMQISQATGGSAAHPLIYAARVIARDAGP